MSIFRVPSWATCTVLAVVAGNQSAFAQQAQQYGHEPGRLAPAVVFGDVPKTDTKSGQASSDNVAPPNVVTPAPAGPNPTPPPAKPVPVKPWKVMFYDNDFGYKNSPCGPYFFGEELKEIPLDWMGCDSWISAGGEFRFRHMNELNRLRPGGPGRSTYDLWRSRNYVDLRYSDAVRGYVEILDASIFNQELPVTGIDLNRWNIQNAFVDLRVAQLNNGSIYLRAGRQELLYGSQRLVSPLDWSNTRRNFEGLKLFSHGENWDIDAWTTHPVNTAAGHGPLALYDNGRDKGDHSRLFSGAWAVFHGMQNHIFDFYWLWDRDTDLPLTGAKRSRHTVGSRWQHNSPVKNECCEVTRIWHLDVEGGYQFGHDTSQDVRAAFFTAGLGHSWKNMPWAPSFWVYYDWASGDDNQFDDETNTFQQLFPLGHAYLGIIDNVARQNISDVNCKLVMKPMDKLTLIAQMHWMDLATDKDRIYNVAGVPLGTRNVGDEIGEELDLVGNYQVNANLGIQAGYSWFWYGSAVENSGLRRGDASQFYLQTTLRY